MTPSPFRTFHSYMHKLFGCKVYKLSIDGGFTCPNRDGTKGSGGCIFCDEFGSFAFSKRATQSIQEQVKEQIERRKKIFKAHKFIAYFQSFTNTYLPADKLKMLYEEALSASPDIVGLSISTRSDCVDEEKISLIASYRKKLPYVSVEYGMQTIHDRTLKLIQRGETHKDFLKAYALTQKHELDSVIHVILGLPGEGHEEMMATADTLGHLKVKGVKIHLLVAMENTLLAQNYREGKWKPMAYEEYVPLVCDFLEKLPRDCVIHRLAGNGHPSRLIAPLWIWEKKKEILLSIRKEMQKRYRSLFQKQPSVQ